MFESRHRRITSRECLRGPLPRPNAPGVMHGAGPDITYGNIQKARSVLTLASQEPAEMLCPRLQSIHLLHTHTSDDGLLEFIRSRTGPHLMNNNHHLLRVHVHFDRPMQVDIMPSLQVLIDNGLDVSLHYDPPPVFSYSPSEGNKLLDAEWASWSTT
ncbi:hypothetical protein B0H10DRAFT_2343695, partial [Mycena sp. CBHHK59/15]